MSRPLRRRPNSNAGTKVSRFLATGIARSSRKRAVYGCPRGATSKAAPPPINRDITISEGITVKELSEKLDVKANLVIKKLVDRGIFATINQTLDAKLATELAREFGASTSTVTYEEEAMQEVEIAEEDKRSVPPPARGHHHGPRRSR